MTAGVARVARGRRSRRPRSWRRSAGLAALVAVLAGCGAGAPSAQTPSGSAAGSGAGASITVFAAASLARPFEEIGAQVERTHPGSDVRFQFAGSADLVTQLREGAPGDVLATADEASMARAASAGLVEETAPFATNTLTIVVPTGNPAAITSFADLARDGVATVVCAPQVPCGAATERVEALTGVRLSPVSEENRVDDVLGKITSGQADAGVVYVTDALRAGEAVARVDVPEADRAVNRYPIGVLAGAGGADASHRGPNRALATAFVDAVRGGPGRAALARAGFGTP